MLTLKSKIDIGVSIPGATSENRAGAGAGVGAVGWVDTEQKNGVQYIRIGI